MVSEINKSYLTRYFAISPQYNQPVRVEEKFLLPSISQEQQVKELGLGYELNEGSYLFSNIRLPLKDIKQDFEARFPGREMEVILLPEFVSTLD